MAEQEAKERKRRQQEEERMMEMQFREHMMNKLAEQDRI